MVLLSLLSNHNGVHVSWWRRGGGSRKKGGGEGAYSWIHFTLRLIFTSVHFGWQAFSKVGPLISAVIAKKKDPKKPGKFNKAQKSKFLKCSCACKFQFSVSWFTVSLCK